MRKLRVLIAEEKNPVAARLAAHLEGLGHRVLNVVRDAPTAVVCALRLQPDLLLLDLRLPPRDGIEATRAILTRHVFPVILLTGYSAADIVRRAQEAGVLACLVWPADARALGSAISVALARFRELKVLAEQDGDLQRALRTRMVVERAKKLLIRRLELGEADAFGYLRCHSMSTGTPLAEVAASLLMAEAMFGRLDLVGCVEAMGRALAQREALRPHAQGDLPTITSAI